MSEANNKGAEPDRGGPEPSGRPAGRQGRRTIHVEALARVEGEGALHLVMDDGQVRDVQLNIFEPPRHFEAFLRGRDFQEVPDIVARICGICPVAYQMSACHALEKAMGVFDQVDDAIRSLRNLFYCGEWVESHMVHMFMMHLPDFLGYESAVSMAADHRDVVQRSLQIRKVGNQIVEMQGGRAVHPVGACVGGFHRPPREDEVAALRPDVAVCRDDMHQLMLELARMIPFPDVQQDYEFVALCPEDEYPMNLGRIRSNKGLDVDQSEFGEVIEERQVAHSNALHAVIRGRDQYMVGPLARLNLNAEKLHPQAAKLLGELSETIGQRLPWRNAALSFLARGVEVVHSLALGAELLDAYTVPPRSRIPLTPCAGTGRHGTEAPRGLCWHEYRTEADGAIADARIIPPTSQNQRTIESDLRAVAPTVAALPDEEATLRCEHVIRHYDPCISCSVHFLRLKRRQGGKR